MELKTLVFPHVVINVVQDPFDWLSFTTIWGHSFLSTAVQVEVPSCSLNHLASLGVGVVNIRSRETGDQNSSPGSVTLC